MKIRLRTGGSSRGRPRTLPPTRKKGEGDKDLGFLFQIRTVPLQSAALELGERKGEGRLRKSGGEEKGCDISEFYKGWKDGDMMLKNWVRDFRRGRGNFQKKDDDETSREEGNKRKGGKARKVEGEMFGKGVLVWDDANRHKG